MKEVITMHGWCGESSNWIRWMQSFENSGWVWHNNERGYGAIKPKVAEWSKNIVTDSIKKQTLICHSLGLHLISKTILEQASHIILISSFSRFIPRSEDSRSINTALRGMKRSLGTLQEKGMLRKFLEKSYRPYPLPMSTIDLLKKELSPYGRERLAEDLELLTKTNGLPNGFPKKSIVLVIHGEKDAILADSTKMQLITDLTTHQKIKPIHWIISGGGHSLLQPEVMHRVKEWIDSDS